MTAFKRWLKRLGLGFLVVVGLLVAAGAIFEQASRWRAAKHFPPMGQMVDIGGRRLQLDCRGHGSPIVVLEAGAVFSGAVSWAPVHDAIANITRTCAYSRAGLMWSEPRAGRTTGHAVAEDLHALLTSAGERPPYVLAGHSLGGSFAIIYTKRHPTDVAGLVFVDASHPDQYTRLKGLLPGAMSAEDQASAQAAFSALNALVWTGLVRAAYLLLQQDPQAPPEYARVVAAYAAPSFGAMLDEAAAVPSILQEAGAARALGDRPTYVLTAMKPATPEELAALRISSAQFDRMKQGWNELHDDMASWSTRSRREIVPDAGHYMQLDRPDVVIAAVRAVVDEVRSTHGPCSGGASPRALSGCARDPAETPDPA